MGGPFEWRLGDIERKADEAVRRLYEIDSIRSDVGSLERSMRELRSEIDGLRIEFQDFQVRTTQDLADIRAMLETFEGRCLR